MHFYLFMGLGRHMEQSRDRVSMSSMSSLWLLHGRELQRAGREARRLAEEEATQQLSQQGLQW